MSTCGSLFAPHTRTRGALWQKPLLCHARMADCVREFREADAKGLEGEEIF